MKTIKLTKGFEALVDDDDFDYLNQFKWYASVYDGKVYAKRNVKDSETKRVKRIIMHRVIMNIDSTKDVIDHINGNGLDNTKENLRVCSHGQNMKNRTSVKNSSSKYLGVSFCKKSKKFHVKIESKGVKYDLGRHLNEKEAALIYNAKAIELHGEFANLNKIL